MTTNELTLQGFVYLKVTLEHSQGLERSKPGPQWELPEGNSSPSASLTNDPWPSSWLAGENLKMPLPPFWLRA